jgi:AcrR family transcriptional regulator
MKKRSDVTRKQIELAFYRIQRGRPRVVKPGRRLSILAVAEEAEVTAAAIHNTYPDLAEQIRAAVGKTTRIQRDAKQDELREATARNRELRAELQDLKQRVERLASQNARLLAENLTLKAIAAADNVIALPPKL